MTCPRCSVSEISPLTGKCDLCGYSVAAAVVVEPADLLAELAARQLAHEFTFGELIGRGKESAVYRAKELSSGRATAVVKLLIESGVPADRLVAAGFGEFQPLDTADTDEAKGKNRRIELKLTEK